MNIQENMQHGRGIVEQVSEEHNPVV